jgi:hypothetical protein
MTIIIERSSLTPPFSSRSTNLSLDFNINVRRK